MPALYKNYKMYLKLIGARKFFKNYAKKFALFFKYVSNFVKQNKQWHSKQIFVKLSIMQINILNN